MTWTPCFVTALLVIVLSGCSSPKPPPGWPTGDEQPINAPQVTKATK